MGKDNFVEVIDQNDVYRQNLNWPIQYDDNDKISCRHKQSTSAITKAIKNMLAGKTRIGHHRLHLLKMNICTTMTKSLQCNTKHLEASRAIAENTQEVIHQKDARGENLVVTCFTGAPAQLEQYLDDNETC